MAINWGKKVKKHLPYQVKQLMDLADARKWGYKLVHNPVAYIVSVVAAWFLGLFETAAGYIGFWMAEVQRILLGDVLEPVGQAAFLNPLVAVRRLIFRAVSGTNDLIVEVALASGPFAPYVGYALWAIVGIMVLIVLYALYRLAWLFVRLATGRP